MDIKIFVLSFYENAADGFHIHRITQSTEAVKLHSHAYYQVYYVHSGKIIHHVQYAAAELSFGDVFILPPDVPHFIELPEETADFYSMSFMPDFFQGPEGSGRLVADFLHHLTASAAESIQPKISLPEEDIPFIETLFERILNEFSADRAGKKEIIQEYVSLFLSILARFYFEEQAESLRLQAKRETITHCIAYIQNHFDEDLTLAEIARRFAMSRTGFCSLFSSVTGTSFKNYLNGYRIQKACEMIRSGEKASNVGLLCGYSDYSTFHRNFKKFMTVSPAQYREG